MIEAPATGGPSEQENAGRPMRADARRNYDLLVEAAREVFAQEGGGASMEAIARKAGVGVGTLYRHFPKRIDVVEAVYRTDVDVLVQVAEQVATDLEPWPAVVAFLEAFVRYAQGSAPSSTSSVRPSIRARIYVSTWWNASSTRWSWSWNERSLPE